MTEVQSIIRNLENTLDGSPWYGRPVFAVLREVDSSVAYKNPAPGAHSMVELLYHMLTWVEFSLSRMEKNDARDVSAFKKLDWREIDPKLHDWDEGLAALIATHQQIIALLHTRNDAFLDETVYEQNYNFRFMLNGLIQHNIYHLGQIMYIKKWLS